MVRLNEIRHGERADLVAEARAFHRLFYGVTPSDAQLATLVEGAS
jgi:hypothetical protein